MELFLNGRKVIDCELDGVRAYDYPDCVDAYISSAIWADTGKELNEDELNELTEANAGNVQEAAALHCVEERVGDDEYR